MEQESPVPARWSRRVWRFATREAQARGVDAVDLLGVALVGALAGWAFLVALLVAGSPLRLWAMLCVTAIAVCAGRLVEQRHPGLGSLLVLGWAVVIAVHHVDELLAAPLANPLGYANANAAFYVIAGAAAAQVAWRPALRGLRPIGIALAAAFGLLAFVHQSKAGSVLALLLPLVLLARRGPRAVAGLLGAGVLAMVVILAVTVALGAAYDPDAERDSRLDRVVDATLTERRVELWHDALNLLAAHPVTGVGPRRFPANSPTALDNPDAAWAHQEYLQFGAELGVPGLLLALSLVSWGYLRLWCSRRDGTAAAAGVALSALALHAGVDYIWHFWQLPVAVGLLVGAATGRWALHGQGDDLERPK